MLFYVHTISSNSLLEILHKHLPKKEKKNALLLVHDYNCLSILLLLENDKVEKKSLNSNIWTFYVASTDEAIRQLVNLI